MYNDFKLNYLSAQHGDATASQTTSFLNDIGKDVAPAILFNLLRDWNENENSFDKYLSNLFNREDYGNISLVVNFEKEEGENKGKYFILYSDYMEKYIASKPWVEAIGEGIKLGTDGVRVVDNYNEYLFEFLNNFRLEKSSDYEGRKINFIPSPDVFRSIVEAHVEEKIRDEIYAHLDAESNYFRDKSDAIISNILQNCPNLMFHHDYSKKLKGNHQVISLMKGNSDKFKELISFKVDLDGITQYYKNSIMPCYNTIQDNIIDN